MRTGIIASKIAAHAADIAKGIPGAREQDDRMAEARRKLDWDAQFNEALDPETARSIRDSRALRMITVIHAPCAVSSVRSEA